MAVCAYDLHSAASTIITKVSFPTQVAKLARIVKHVIPNRSMELDENVDKNTSNWLAQVCISC